MNHSIITFGPDEISTYYRVRVPNLKQKGKEWRGPCPIHHGKKDSFAVDAATGRWFCHSTCGRGGDIFDLEDALLGGDFTERKDEIFRLVGRMESTYLGFGPRTNGSSKEKALTKPTKPTSEATELLEIERYPYLNEHGQLQFHVVRFVTPKGEKTFRQCRPDGRGGTAWNLKGIVPVPYRLPQVLSADTVYLPEGEKDVHTLERWGLVASCNPGGADNSHLFLKWTDFFAGKHIVIPFDNDAPGRKHAVLKAEALLSTAASLKIVELPGLPEKGDVSDWRDTGGTPEKFQELVETAMPLDAAALAELQLRWGLADREPHDIVVGVEPGHPWPTLQPIQGELPPVEAFSEDLLPDSFRALVRDVSERMQVPMDFPAVVTVLCLAGAVNRRAVIQPKVNDSRWVVVPNLWGGIVAAPGFLKSPVIQAVLRLLNHIQTGWRLGHEEALRKYVREKEEYDLQCQAWKEKFKQNAKKVEPEPPPAKPEGEPHEPVLMRLIVNDATFEALHQTMNQNPAGILVVRDELTGWWSQLDKPGREGERAFCLQAWNGDTGHTIDRIGRGTIHVDACCMSMLGGIQPGRLRSYLVDALEDGPSNDGLIQRFQLLVWPDTAAEWKYVDRVPDAASEQMAAQVFTKLVALDAENPARFRFAPDAQELFIEWLGALESKIRGNHLHPALVSHLSKYRSLMPSLALLFEIADMVSSVGFEGASLAVSENFVSLAHAKQAAEWCEYLESHACRVYSCIVTPQMRAARELADHLKRKHISNKDDGFDWFSARDVYLKGWTGLDTPEAVHLAAEVLEDAGWLRTVQTDGVGRPGVRYYVNPAVWK